MAERDPAGIPLLATKLFIPQVRQSLVSRPRLIELLNAGLRSQLILVCAPAGFGKTTVVSTWAQGLHDPLGPQALDVPVAWLSLDEADNDPARFLLYLVAALQQINPAIGREVQETLEASPMPAPLINATIGALINDLASLANVPELGLGPTPALADPTAHTAGFVLVLDDFHTMDNAAIHEAIQTLVAHQPPHMHLTIVTREDPPLPLARLRALGQLTELRADDLRFSPDETATFLREVMGLALEAHDIEELDDRIEGWIAGLQLAALSMQHRPDPAGLIADLGGTHHFIISYLTEEVLRHLSPDVRSFLLQTSVLTRLAGPLCDAVTCRVDSEAMLEHLYTSNAFVIPLDERHEWYRYHHLFAEMLLSQLRRTQPGLVSTLHTRACEWYEKQGMVAEAIEQAFAAEDYGRVVRLLEEHARPITLQGYARSVGNWLQRLPHEWRVTGPRANLAFGWSLLLLGQLNEVEPYLHNAEAAAAERIRSGERLEANAILTEAGSLRAIVESVIGDGERACERAQEAVDRSPHDDPYLQGIAWFALGTTRHYTGKEAQAIEAYREALPLCREAGNTAACMLIAGNLAMLHIVEGHLHAAAEICRQAIEEIELSPSSLSRSARSPALGGVYSNYSGVLYEWGELDAARRLAERGLELSERGGHVSALAHTRAIVSRVRLALGDIAGAWAALDQAAEIFGHGLPAWVAPHVVAQQVALALTLGDEQAAIQALDRTGLDQGNETGGDGGEGQIGHIDHVNEAAYITRLHLLHYLGRHSPHDAHGSTEQHQHQAYLDQALALAGRLLASAEPAGRMGRVIEVLALRALVYQARGDTGDTERALNDLGRALQMAEPQGYLRLFVNEGAPMSHLLEAARRRGIRPAYVSRLLAAFPSSPHESGAAASLRVYPSLAGPLAEPLTAREVEVLCLMSEGLTYDEVAGRLVVSLNTVRFHVKSIYSKLSVEKRSAAIDRARALGLL